MQMSSAKAQGAQSPAGLRAYWFRSQEQAHFGYPETGNSATVSQSLYTLPPSGQAQTVFTEGLL
jgi:hypothetical protein